MKNILVKVRCFSTKNEKMKNTLGTDKRPKGDKRGTVNTDSSQFLAAQRKEGC